MPDIMQTGDIAFPHLGIYLENIPKGFTVFGFMIAYYGVIIGLGIFVGILMATKEAKRTGQDPDVYWDFAIYAIIFSLIGGRLYFVAFSWDNYKDNLLSILNTRGGGMAIYGAVIAAFLTLIVYAKRKKLDMWQMADTAVPGLMIGQAIGRYGNFMNREAFGGYTDNLFAMRLPIDAVRAGDISTQIAEHIVEGTNYIQVHPTFFYESMWNIGLLLFVMWYCKRKSFQGEIALIYFGGYGLGRLWIEGLRTDQLWIPGTTIAVSQVLAAVMLATSIFVFFYVKKRKTKENNV